MSDPDAYALPYRLTPQTPVGVYILPTRLRTALSRRLPVVTAAELAALPVERLRHITGLGKRTRPVLRRVVLETRERLGEHRMAPRLAGDTPLDDRPLTDLGGELPRRERTALDGIGIRTVAALGEMPRAVLARVDGLGPDALGRLTALCLRDRPLNSLTGIKAALDPARADAVELVYGLRDGVVRSPREVAMILGRRPLQIERFVEPDSLAELPPMRVLAAAVREAIAPVGFAVLSVVAGRIATRLPPGPDDRVDPRAFARLGALLIRHNAAPEDAARVRAVAETRWRRPLLDTLVDVLRTAHALRLDEARMAERLATTARAAGIDDVPADALLVAVAGLCPGIVLSLAPSPAPPPAITDPEIRAIVGAPPVELSAPPPPAPPPSKPPPPPPPPDSKSAVFEAVCESAVRAEAEPDAPLDDLPLPALRSAVAEGGVRALPLARGRVDRLRAALEAEVGPDAVTVVEVGRALTAGLGAMTDVALLDPAERRSRLSTALDQVIDSTSGPGRVTVLTGVSLGMTLGMQPWLTRLLTRRADGPGLLLVAAPGVVDDEGLLIDRLHRLPVVRPAQILG